MKLKGLPGTNGEERESDFFGSFTQAMRALAAGRAVTTAGDKGAINLWIDDAGYYRCAFSVRCITQNTLVTDSRKDVGDWLDRFKPLCGA